MSRPSTSTTESLPTPTPKSTHSSTPSQPQPQPQPPKPALTLNSTIPLPSGGSMPILGYGVYQTHRDICSSVVQHALRSGYRHIDSARAYRNEGPCAEAIRTATTGMSAIGSTDTPLSRSDLFFTSKIGPRDMGYEKTRAAIAASFAETRLEYLDLLLIHAPYGGKDARLGTWRALVEAQDQGLVRALGLSNYGVHHLEELQAFIDDLGKGGDVGVGDTDTGDRDGGKAGGEASQGARTASAKSGRGRIDVGQWEIHPWLPRDDIVNWSREHNIAIQAWSPLVRGQRAHEPVLAEIGAKHSKTWAQVLLRWSLQKGYVPLPKSVTPSRIEDNADVFDFVLDEKDMKRLEFSGSYAPCSWDPTVSRD